MNFRVLLLRFLDMYVHTFTQGILVFGERRLWLKWILFVNPSVAVASACKTMISFLLPMYSNVTLSSASCIHNIYNRHGLKLYFAPSNDSRFKFVLVKWEHPTFFMVLCKYMLASAISKAFFISISLLEFSPSRPNNPSPLRQFG